MNFLEEDISRFTKLKCLHTDNADINIENAYGETALYLATRECHTKITEKLLEHGANVNTDKNPLHVLRDLKSAKLLLNANGDINSRDFQGYSPLQHAVLINNMELVDFLIESGSDINSENSKGETVLHIVCLYLSTPDLTPRKLLAQRLIKMGVNIMKKDSMGKSPLHVACSYSEVNTLDIIKILTNSGASVSDQDLNGWCPIHYFMEKIGSLTDDVDDVCLEIIDLIMPTEEKANTTTHIGKTVLHFAASEARENIISHLIRKGCSVNAVDGRKRNPLHYVVSHERCEEALRVLVEAGADVDSCDAWGKTILHLAIEKKNTKLVNAILRTGADVNLGDIVGRRPIRAASEVGSREICDILVKHGADVDSLDLWLATALHLAAWSDQPGTANFLVETGCDISKTDSRGDNAISVAEFRSSLEFLGVVRDRNSSISQTTTTETKKYSKYGNELLQLDKFQAIIQGCDASLRGELDVDKFLLSVLSAPTVGRGNDEPEALEIHQAVADFAQNIAKLLSVEDPRLICTLFHAGSFSEGTKTRYPDEFDFTVCLEELSDSIYTEHEEMDNKEVLGLSPTGWDEEFLVRRFEEGVNFEEHVAFTSDYTSIYLKPESKYSFVEFTESEKRQIPCSMMYCLFTQFISRILFRESFPKDPRLIIQDVSLGPEIQLQWRGCRYKMLDINVDFVPAVRLPCWPCNFRKSDKFLTKDILELPCLAVPKLPNSFGEDLWRCSMSLQETTIMRKCHLGIRNSYTLAKALVSSAICPVISFENYEEEKMLYRGQHDSLSSDDDEFEIYESAEEVVPSYILKMAFLFSVQHKAELEGIDAVFDQQACEDDCQSDSFDTEHVGLECQYNPKQYGRATRMYISSQSDSIDAEIVSDIFRRCEEWLSSEFVPSFFNPRQNVLRSRMFEGYASKSLHFVKYIRKLLE